MLAQIGSINQYKYAIESLSVMKFIQGFSNGCMEDSWPKVRKGKELLAQILGSTPHPLNGKCEILEDQHHLTEENHTLLLGIS